MQNKTLLYFFNKIIKKTSQEILNRFYETFNFNYSTLL